MLARTSTLRHPAGLQIQTPLLIPSFSSKGLGASARDGKSEISSILEAASEFLTESMLVSAYDFHHGNLDRLVAPITDITVVDSGGYETADQQDLATPYFRSVEALPRTQEDHAKELERWPKVIPAIFVSYDHGQERVPLEEQIATAKELFPYAREQLTTILVRPETKDQRLIQMNRVLASVDELARFSTIGVTEKELGSSALDRMANIARLRFALDDAGSSAPIHIFGCLDPITVPLYYLAGAEIFDGLSWMRYGFFDGVAMYRQNSAALSIGVDRHDDFVKVKTLQDNLGALIDLRNLLIMFLRDYDFARFGRHSKTIETAFELLVARERRLA